MEVSVFSRPTASSWQTGTWGGCSGACGTNNGTQYRTVTCQSPTGQTVADSNCTGPKPATQQACTASDCPILIYSWNTGAWGACTGPCGTGSGTQTRTVQCKSSADEVVGDASCSAPKPDTQQQCTASQCSPLDRYQPRDPVGVGAAGSIILDTVTGLEWQRCSVGQTWDASQQRCKGNANSYRRSDALIQATPDGFRLPTISELRSLVYCSTGDPVLIGMWYDETECEGPYEKPTILSEAFPDTDKWPFWSASPYQGSSSVGWQVWFQFGAVVPLPANASAKVRLVRIAE